MAAINPGEVWLVDFGMAAKVRPALLLTGNPASDELDLVTVLLHTTALRQSLGVEHSKILSKTGCVPFTAGSNHFHSQT